MLELEAVHANYGQGQVLRGIDLRVAAGEVVALLGRNGAGKSTALKTVMGLVRTVCGELRFGGTSIKGRAPEAICRLGIGWVPEDRRIFPGLSVEENLRMGFFQ
ncbi:MAG: ATP-binding cassette domain-containing protein, partial [Chitinophagaceae bacterium]|nr:ATP-binding cassette domain-containing protein [Rubrivivax sp.]